jgi:hypothetical protein
MELRPSRSVNIFLRGKAAVEARDVIIADVSRPSMGSGWK